MEEISPSNRPEGGLFPGSSGSLLQPSYAVAIGVMVLGLASLGLLPLWGGALWLALGVAVFGLFLLLQTSLLRLEFGGDALLVWRQQSLLRRFPYGEWLGWKLFWPGLPVLFYFREQGSIHFLPVLFDATSLREQLVQHLDERLGQLTKPEPTPNPSDV
ncbi:DUF3119 family protein [Cyanobium sp. WAJ14-Wanaka]|uniref:DUF3119 family protein n=1 Tax=Cyanobium sp. WAJ14-Wanaka TaxID=2823725 RepID=UPI0020CFB223|nr:DUF3119 family protein [Cyanobium sp. WAJ14-Wanaka]MCP9774007.1 DUF3119 family protein [Cyanobium sp. WAJ14-Wanaka]